MSVNCKKVIHNAETEKQEKSSYTRSYSHYPQKSGKKIGLHSKIIECLFCEEIIKSVRFRGKFGKVIDISNIK